MKDEELLEFLKAGGGQRQKALIHIYKHEKIRNEIRIKLKSFEDRLKYHFPAIKIELLTRKAKFEKSYVEEFFIRAIIVLDKNIREKKFRGSSFNELKKFLISTAYFKCIGWLRSLKYYEPIEIDDSDKIGYEELFSVPSWQKTFDDPDKAFLNNARIQKLKELIKRLSETCRKILNLVLQEYTNTEIAEILNFTNNSLRVLRSKCRKNLENLILEDEELYDLYLEFITKKNDN